MLLRAIQEALKPKEEMESLLFAVIYYIYKKRNIDKGRELLSILNAYLNKQNPLSLRFLENISEIKEIIECDISLNPLKKIKNLIIIGKYSEFYKKIKSIKCDKIIEKFPPFEEMYELRGQLSYKKTLSQELSILTDMFDKNKEDENTKMQLKAFMEHSYFNYLGAIYRAKKFKLLIEEYAFSHLWNSTKGKNIKLVISPKANHKNEAGLRFMFLPENKNIVFSLSLFNQGEIYGYIKSTPEHIKKIMMRSAVSDLDALFDEIHASNPYSLFHGYNWEDLKGTLWKLTFGSEILGVFDERGTMITKYKNATIAKILDLNNINKLKIIPSSWMYSISLSSAYDNNNDKFALQYYDISYHSDWKKKKHIKNKKHSIMITDQVSADLPFVNLEGKFINENTSIALQKLSWNETYDNFDQFKSNLFYKIQNANVVYFSGHADRSLIFKRRKMDNEASLNDISSAIEFNDALERKMIMHNSDHYIKPEEISTLDLSGSIVILNTCFGSTSSHYSFLNNENLASSFLAAGAEHVLATINPINDYDAFRFSCRLSELLFMQSVPFRKAYRKVSIECMENTIPNYLEFIKENSVLNTYVEALYHAKNSTVKWQSYTYWESY